MRVRITESSGNVFADIGFSPLEAGSLRLRAELMHALLRLMADDGLTQAAAAKRFGVSQPRVSDLARHKIDRFRIDTLVRMLMRAGAHVAVTVRRPGRAA